MIALVLIRQQPHYRRDAFVNGLKRAGYKIVASGRPASLDDVLVIWNRYGSMASMADQWERDGGTVLVCENGYIGKDSIGRQLYAISAHGHNGSGWFPVGDEDRWTPLGIPLAPFQKNIEGHFLVCGQRGIGSKTMASPPDWHRSAAKRLPVRPLVRIRLHPGNDAPSVPIEKDLEGALGCVIWSSSSGVKALTLGIPVYYDAPHWICEGAAERLADVMRSTPLVDPARRLESLQRMAWAQWRIDEIDAGEPFVRMREGLAKLERRPW